MWLLFAAEPANYGLLADTAEGLGSLAAVERLVLSVGGERWRLLSTVEKLSADTVAARMRATSPEPSWEAEIAAETARISSAELTERRFWLWVYAGRVPLGSDLVGWGHRILRTVGYTRPARPDAMRWDQLAARSEQVESRAAERFRFGRRRWPRRPLCWTGYLSGATPPTPLTEPEDHPHLALPHSPQGAVTVGRGIVEGSSAWHRGAAEWCEPTSGVALATNRHGAVAHTDGDH